MRSNNRIFFRPRYKPPVIAYSFDKENSRKFLAKVIKEKHWYVSGDKVCANVKAATVKLFATDDYGYMDLHYNGYVHRFKTEGPSIQYELIYRHYNETMDKVEAMLDDLLRDMEIDEWTVNDSKKLNVNETSLLKVCVENSLWPLKKCWNICVKTMITTVSAVKRYLRTK